MPSARSAFFADTPVVTDAQRQAPPQSEGLRAPAAIARRADKARRQDHPAPPGPMSEEKRAEVVDLTMRLMDKLSASEIAVRAGVSADGAPVRAIIRQARQSLQARAAFYIEAHALATIAAAAEGNAKPAQWALERIAEGEDRVVDPVQAEAPVAPTAFNIGFVMGGLPMPTQKAIEGKVVSRD